MWLLDAAHPAAHPEDTIKEGFEDLGRHMVRIDQKYQIGIFTFGCFHPELTQEAGLDALSKQAVSQSMIDSTEKMIVAYQGAHDVKNDVLR